MRIYLDVCCLNRPFDDQSQARIRIETEAVKAVAERVSRGVDQWISSATVEWEVRRNPDAERRSRVLSLLDEADERIELSDEVSGLAQDLESRGLRAADAMHAAFAIAGECDVLLTTDDRFVRRAASLDPALPVSVRNPASWVLEVNAG